MARLVRFLQRSVDEIRHSVKTYIRKSIIVPCQACSNHVHIRVIDFLAEPEKPIEIKCTKCDHTVCFTTKQSTGRRTTVGHTSGSPYPEWTTHNGGSSLETQTQVESNTGSSLHQNPTASKRSVSYTATASPGPVSQSVLKPKQEISNKRLSALSNDFRAFYEGRGSASNDGSNEYSDQDSTVGRSESLRSFISLARRPSLPQQNPMLGLDECWQKAGGSDRSWGASSFLPWLCSASPQSAMGSPSLSDSHHLSSGEKVLEKDDTGTSTELGEREDDRSFGSLLNHRESKDSIDLIPGKVEMKSYEGKDILHLFEVDFETGKHLEPAPASDSDRGSIRGNISEKRRGKLPQRSNAIHRAAVSRRHSQKIEEQEAEKLSAMRRNSLNSDFEVEPTDEQVRQAQKIYTDAKKQQLPYQDIDIQWARGILRARKNWEALRYEHPLVGSMEHLQQKPRNSIDLGVPPYCPEAIRHSFPFAASSPPNMSPRISRLSLQPLPTPVEEEPEGDMQDLVGDPISFAGSPGGVVPPGALEVSGTRIENIATSKNELVPISTAKETELSHPGNKEGVCIRNMDSPKISRLGSKNTNTRYTKTFKNIARRMSCFRRIGPQSSIPPILPNKSISQPQSTSIPSVEAVGTIEVEVPPTEEPRASGEIRGVPTSEEPFILAGNAISSLVRSMGTPLVEIEVKARHEDLFPSYYR